MEAASHASHQHHHEMPTSGSALTSVSISATLHCLTGCALGEIAGVAIGTAFGFSNGATIALAIGLAFLFGYSLTSLPLLRAGLALGAVIPIALASDTLSIATMEAVDNLILVVIPGAMDAGLGTLLFWGSLAFALVIAGAFAVPVNRWLIARGKGHSVVHETGIHGGPPVKLVAWVTAVAFVFGSTVLVAEALSGEDEMGSHGAEMAAEHEAAPAGDPVRGLAMADGGMRLELATTAARVGGPTTLAYRVVDDRGATVRDFEIEHTKPMHLIVVRRDLTGFQHLHPRMRPDGTWTTPVTLQEAGSYRVFADFARNGERETLAGDLNVDGPVDWTPTPPPSEVARTDGYEVRLGGGGSGTERSGEVDFEVTRGGAPVDVQPYLGADGHLVALREGDLAFLHVHPIEGEGPARRIAFETEFPSAGRYRLFLQFKHDGRVHTAAFTREVSDGSN